MKIVRPKKRWELSSHSFNCLLSWFDEGANSSGQTYLEIRQRLVAYFDRKNCPAPDDLADETLNRVARRLEEEGVIETEPPAKYCYIVARFVFMEQLRSTQKENLFFTDLRRQPQANNLAAPEVDDNKEGKQKMLNCLEQCANNLEASSRRIILRYYVGKERVKIENRRGLAASLGISMNALSIRACRIREKLETCIRQCVGAE
jgi:DNA-directed RNA polymerase specialized sigma24 family protein